MSVIQNFYNFIFCYHVEAAEQRFELPVICDVMMSMWCSHNRQGFGSDLLDKDFLKIFSSVVLSKWQPYVISKTVFCHIASIIYYLKDTCYCCTTEVWEWMDKWFHPTIYNGCNYLSLLQLELIHVSKKGPNKLSTCQHLSLPGANMTGLLIYIAQNRMELPLTSLITTKFFVKICSFQHGQYIDHNGKVYNASESLMYGYCW